MCPGWFPERLGQCFWENLRGGESRHWYNFAPFILFMRATLLGNGYQESSNIAGTKRSEANKNWLSRHSKEHLDTSCNRKGTKIRPLHGCTLANKQYCKIWSKQRSESQKTNQPERYTVALGSQGSLATTSVKHIDDRYLAKKRI